MLTRRAALAAAATLPFAPRIARAWAPDRPVNMIVAFAPGGGTDIAARTLARAMEKDLGQSVVVTNRGGAGGEIGWSELARAKPDGLTIGFINTPNIVTIPIERQARFKLEDFSPIANLVDDPGGFWVLKDSPIRSLEDLIAQARANPGNIGYGTTGVGSDDHLATLAFERLTGIRMLHVPFAGSSQVRNALLGGTLPVAAMNMGEGVNDMRNGLIRPLGQMGPTRWEGTPDVPTFREQGFDIVQGSMRGVAAPAGTPKEALDRLALSVRRSLDDPEFRKAAEAQLLPLRYLGPEEHLRELLAMRKAYEQLWAVHPWRD